MGWDWQYYNAIRNVTTFTPNIVVQQPEDTNA